MIVDKVLAKVFGTKNEREIKLMQPAVAAICALEPAIGKLSDAELAQKTIEFKEKIARGATLDDLLVEAFAVVREAGRRVLNMRHFNVQLMGGMVLHKGRIAEMKTGEGKTLVATLPCYLNALSGKGVHVVTVNDYLAKRDSEWMGRLYKFLGLHVGVIVHDLSDEERKAAYGADITYGTNNEFGFDYLRDNMKFRIADCVQREYNYAIVDEVDSILIDEARTPLIISGPSEESTDKYYKINRIIPKLIRGEVIEGKEPGERYTTGDYTIDEKHKAAALTEEGVLKVEKLLGLGNLYDPNNIEYNHHVQQALARPRALQTRHRVRGQRRRRGPRSNHRRRIHRPSDARTPLVRRSPPSGGSQGRRQNPARKSDARHHHVPELFPHVQEALRYDGYGGNRSGRVPKDLQHRCSRGAHQPRDDPQGESGPGVSHRRREIPQRRQGNQGIQRQGPARAGGHHLGGKIREIIGHPQADGRPA